MLAAGGRCLLPLFFFFFFFFGGGAESRSCGDSGGWDDVGMFMLSRTCA